MCAPRAGWPGSRSARSPPAGGGSLPHCQGAGGLVASRTAGRLAGRAPRGRRVVLDRRGVATGRPDAAPSGLIHTWTPVGRWGIRALRATRNSRLRPCAGGHAPEDQGEVEGGPDPFVASLEMVEPGIEDGLRRGGFDVDPSRLDAGGGAALG